MRKYYVLDTNILIHTAGNVIYGFEDNRVVVTHISIEELDHHKKDYGETGYGTRQASRIIDNLIESGDPTKGIKMKNGGTFYLISDDDIDISCLLPTWNPQLPDNLILSMVVMLKKKHPKTPVILITNDRILRLRAKAIHVDCERYNNEYIADGDTYTGREVLLAPSEYVNEIYSTKRLDVNKLNIDHELVENEFVRLIDETTVGQKSEHSALCWYRNGELQLINHEKNFYKSAGITPLNEAQSFFMEALLAPVDEIPLVIVKGPAGGGKTFVAMAVGNYEMENTGNYKQVLIGKSSTVPKSEQIGYLPGGLQEKLDPVLASFYDNLEDIYGDGIVTEDKMNSGDIGILPIGFTRGRSIKDRYIVIDEAQNLTSTQVITIITRAGKGSKIIMIGDPDQIDDENKVDRINNGLCYAYKKMRGSKLCAELEFTEDECVRSPLAKEASVLLKK